MNIPRVISTVLSLAIILLSRVPVSAQSPAFTQDKMTLTCVEYATQVKHDFKQTPAVAEYDVKIRATVTIPKELDFVCVTDKFRATSAIDAKKNSLLKLTPRGAANRARDDFNAFLGPVAATDLDKTEFTGNPYLITKMTVEAAVVHARERKDATIPAKVVEDPVDIGHGMTVRLSVMKINNQRDVDLTVEFTRPQGTGGSILESIIALDAKGKELGGGRWGKGLRIFEGKGKFQTQFEIPGGSNIASLKCVMVTKYDVKPITFTIEGVFQK